MRLSTRPDPQRSGAVEIATRRRPLRWQHRPKRSSCLHFWCEKAQPLRPSGTAQAPFDKRCHIPVTLSVERFGRFGKEGSDLIVVGTRGTFLVEGKRLQGVHFPGSSLGFHPGRDYVPCVPIRSCSIHETDRPTEGEGRRLEGHCP